MMGQTFSLIENIEKKNFEYLKNQVIINHNHLKLNENKETNS